MTPAGLKREYLAGLGAKHDHIHRMHELLERLFVCPGLVAESDVARIVVEPDGLKLQTRRGGVWLRMNPVDERLPPIEILSSAAFDATDTKLVPRVTEGAQTVCDVGASIGWRSLNSDK